MYNIAPFHNLPGETNRAGQDRAQQTNKLKLRTIDQLSHSRYGIQTPCYYHVGLNQSHLAVKMPQCSNPNCTYINPSRTTAQANIRCGGTIDGQPCPGTYTVTVQQAADTKK